MKKLLVIVPAYNEQDNILNTINELKIDMPIADIIVINDCSKDNTLNILRDNDINYITPPFNLGYSGAIQTGFKYAAEQDYEYVAQFDGDGQHIAAELNKMFKIMEEKKVDIVIGSRFMEETEYNHAFFRKIGTKVFQILIKLICKQKITDPTSGLQILNKKVYTRYAKINNYPDYPDANLLAEMLLLGYQIVEIPVKMRERVAGVSMHTGLWNPFKYMIKMFYSIILILIKYKSTISKGEIRR